ncbi:hypothetical protein [Rhizomonospora bruguierae]|uniref:hypothetical protein n=1 Tax=Rhizomonospora bruguierae TaxID=1581705 RepID=UPI001BCE7002|nr:hypothetical protein [Micromonospora sp. NBRC 107566]
MSRIFVTGDDQAAIAEVRIDDVEGFATAACLTPGCGWATEPDRFDDLRDAVEDAGIHVDRPHHPGGAPKPPAPKPVADAVLRLHADLLDADRDGASSNDLAQIDQTAAAIVNQNRSM